MSSAAGKEWVSEQRQAASLHRKLAHPTCASGGSSSAWPTPTGIHADRGNHDEPVENYQKRVTDYEEGRAKGKPGKRLGVAVNWPTPDVSVEKYRLQGKTQQSESLEALARRGILTSSLPCGRWLNDPRINTTQQVTTSVSMDTVHDTTSASRSAMNAHQMTSSREASSSMTANLFEVGPVDLANTNTTGNRQGLLNPAWVETLMGFPSGWTDSVRLATLSYQQSQREHSQPSGES
jgi:hypothetical protein